MGTIDAQGQLTWSNGLSILNCTDGTTAETLPTSPTIAGVVSSNGILNFPATSDSSISEICPAWTLQFSLSPANVGGIGSCTASTTSNHGTYTYTCTQSYYETYTGTGTPIAPSMPGPVSGLWWNANESGWGIHFTQRGSKVFVAWYTYDSAGKPKWYVSTCTGATGSSGTCNGDVFEVTGPPYFGAAFNPSAVNAVKAGTLTLTFTNANGASMFYSVGGVSRTVALTRQPLATGTIAPAVDYTDIWWNPNESGWGMAMAQQYSVTFLAWYVYDASGKPTWLVATCTMNGNGCTGTLYRTTGPAFGPTFNPNAVQATTAGTVTVTFTDNSNAVLNYTVGGVAGTKNVTRQLF